jgi:hypothetical protein
MSGVTPPLPLFAFMAPTGTSFCFDLRLRLQFHISSCIVVYVFLSCHRFAPCLSVCHSRFAHLFLLFTSPFIILISLFYFSGVRFCLISCCIFVCFRFPCTVRFHPHVAVSPYYCFLCACLRLAHLFTVLFFNFVTNSAYDCFLMSLYPCLFPFIVVLLLFFPPFCSFPRHFLHTTH